MPESVWDAEVQSTLDQAYQPGVKLVYVGNRNVEVLTPFPSPIDWRDTWIYFMMVDRFNNPAVLPRHQSWNQPWSDGDPVSREVVMKKGPILWLMSKTKTNPQTTVYTQQR